MQRHGGTKQQEQTVMTDFLIVGAEAIASALGTHRTKLRNLKDQKHLPIWKWQGRWVILKEDLHTWLKSERNRQLTAHNNTNAE
jgi:hypothetical protein